VSDNSAHAARAALLVRARRTEAEDAEAGVATVRRREQRRRQRLRTPRRTRGAASQAPWLLCGNKTALHGLRALYAAVAKSGALLASPARAAIAWRVHNGLADLIAPCSRPYEVAVRMSDVRGLRVDRMQSPSSRVGHHLEGEKVAVDALALGRAAEHRRVRLGPSGARRTASQARWLPRASKAAARGLRALMAVRSFSIFCSRGAAGSA
jgi:hypothetical protein